MNHNTEAQPKPVSGFPVKVPFVQGLGMELLSMRDGHSEVQLQITAAHVNTWDVAHGGVLMTMLDVAMAMAARSAHTGGAGVATIEMKTTFMRAAEGHLRGLGHVQHTTATMAFCNAEVFDDAGHLCAAATGTFKYLRGLPTRSGVKPQTHAAGRPVQDDITEPKE